MWLRGGGRTERGVLRDAAKREGTQTERQNRGGKESRRRGSSKGKKKGEMSEQPEGTAREKE